MSKKGLLPFLCLPFLAQAQYVHQDGKIIADGNGNNLLLRGLGIGGWMLQEGYMLKTGSFAGPQHKIKEKITELIGKEKTDTFYKTWRENGLTKRDVDSLTKWGFNSIRLPMHYNLYTLPIEAEPKAGENTWLEDGFKMTDDLLEWCAANKIYLILDMHATPGGQGNDANICDRDTEKPALWESEANKKKLIALWKKLAERYKNSPWIAGYDLINEPNYPFSGTHKNGCDETSNAPLRQIYLDLTHAIREVDRNHLIIIEGNCWGNNYQGVFPLWDHNMALSFHKYWNHNTAESIKTITDLRNQLKVPIWLGESGENSNVWFTDCISLMEYHNIGWAFWPMKKIDNIAGIAEVKITADYQKLLDYWEKGGTKPSPEFAEKALMQIVDNFKIDKVLIKNDVKDAMFRQISSRETLPFKKHTVPGLVFATEFDLGRNELAYSDKDLADYWVDEGSRTAGNSGGKMRNDAVDIEKCTDKRSNGFQVTKIEDGEWLLFTVSAAKEGLFDVSIRYHSTDKTGKLYLETNGNSSATLSLIPTGEKIWQTLVVPNVKMVQGDNKVKLVFETGGFNLNYLEFKPIKKTVQRK